MFLAFGIRISGQVIVLEENFNLLLNLDVDCKQQTCIYSEKRCSQILKLHSQIYSSELFV